MIESIQTHNMRVFPIVLSKGDQRIDVEINPSTEQCAVHTVGIEISDAERAALLEVGTLVYRFLMKPETP